MRNIFGAWASWNVLFHISDRVGFANPDDLFGT